MRSDGSGSKRSLLTGGEAGLVQGVAKKAKFATDRKISIGEPERSPLNEDDPHPFSRRVDALQNATVESIHEFSRLLRK